MINKIENKIEVAPLPPRILMDLKSDCNLKCPMCVVHGDTENPQVQDIIGKNMSKDVVKKILHEVSSVQPSVGPSLWSEPLLNKDLLTHLKSMKSHGMNVSINTNGLALTESMARSLVEIGINSITVSIDAITPETLLKVRGIDKLVRIEQNILKLLSIRGGKSLPRIGVSFTKQSTNLHEHDRFIQKWTEIVDFVRTGELFADTKFPGIRIDRTQRKPCPELYNTMAIHTNGDVSICCLDGFKDMIVGNVATNTVQKVWQGETMQKIRRNHENGDWDQVPFCKNCDRWASSDYQEKTEGKLLIRKSTEYTFYNRLDRLENWNRNCRHENTVTS
jgi:radical SAM protein with 4Fe4S-binding SPASM domain